MSPTDVLRREPTAPLVMLLLMGALPYFVITTIVQVPRLQQAAIRFGANPKKLLTVAAIVAAVTLVLMFGDFLRARKPPPFRVALRVVRSIAYASALAFAAFLFAQAEDATAYDQLAQTLKAKALLGATFFGAGVFAYIASQHPWGVSRTATGQLTPYQNVVASLRNTYDFVIGVEFPDDKRQARAGAKRWHLFPRDALWTNFFIFGGVGSGKTSRVAYPFLQQAIQKFPDDEKLRPSVVLLDLKGDNAEKVYDFAKKFGRADEFWCISPGNELPTENGKELIPKDRFLTWNPVGGTDASDIRALQLYDAFEATNSSPSHQYFKDVQGEFLTATVQLFDSVRGKGKLTLLDLYSFGLEEAVRQDLIEAARGLDDQSAKGAVAYFDGKFNQMPPKDKAALISGLTAKLGKLSSPTLQSTFCQPDGAPNAFTSFHDLVVNKPGIIVFSVPDSLYSEELARLLGIAFLRRFQTQQLERTTTVFRAGGGNVDRLVLNVVDECWAYMNAKVASFTAVSRQSKTSCLFLSQSLDQIGQEYRDTVIGNFRSKGLLGVNDPLTLQTFERLFGEEEQEVEVESVGESLQQVKQGIMGDVDARSRGMTASRSFQKRMVARYPLTAIQELGGGRGVFHLFDGQDQQEPLTLEFCPWYRLPYFLFHPLSHPDYHCKKSGPREPHIFVRDGRGKKCTACGHQLDEKKAAELHQYQNDHPSLFAVGAK